ncbi:hypothetical protein DY000_02043162 [Brassica cretica]|uniref:Uncharacterized protein n=1 Tax=Brassica cretica TaxID=69181 RepID=A0ABQ7BJV5_BRACR|nr:hypothetical protein DY000_02043162 [Brassica cretica]
MLVTAYGIRHTAYGIRHTAYGIRHTAYAVTSGGQYCAAKAGTSVLEQESSMVWNGYYQYGFVFCFYGHHSTNDLRVCHNSYLIINY